MGGGGFELVIEAEGAVEAEAAVEAEGTGVAPCQAVTTKTHVIANREYHLELQLKPDTALLFIGQLSANVPAL